MNQIKITRFKQTKESTISKVSVTTADTKKGELASFYILERPGPDTTTSGLRLRIPEGTYKVKWAETSATPSLNTQAPLPWIYNSDVAASRMIYIHHGNFPKNTDGCLLVGKSYGSNQVGSSVDALKALKKFLTRVGVSQVEVVIGSAYED